MPFQKLGLAVPEQRSALESPVVPLASHAAWSWFEGSRTSDAAESVNPATAFATATANACVQLLASSVATATPKLYRRVGAGKAEAFHSPLHNLLSLEPNPECTSHTLWSSFVLSMALWGNGYAEIQRNGLGTVLGLWFVNPASVTPFRKVDGSLAFRTTALGQSTPAVRVIEAENMIHVPWLSSDGVTGISPIQAARNAFGSDIAMERSAGRFFGNFSVPQLALLTKKLIKPEVKHQMRSDWEAIQSGSNQHRVAILDGEMDLKVLSVSNADSQFLESRKFSREQICGMFGLKPSQIGSESRVSGETFSGQQLDFLTGTLGPLLKKIEQELTRKLLAGLPSYSIRHDVSDRLRLDIKSQMDAFSIGRQWGLMTSNECRRELGMDPGGPECDEYWRPVNMVDASAPNPIQTEETTNG